MEQRNEDSEQLYQEALEAITRVFSDQSISRGETKQNLEGLKDEIDVLLDTLK